MIKIIFIHGLLGSKYNFEYLEKEFSQYYTESVELIGFGREHKPRVEYDINDFLGALEQKLNLNEDNEIQLILIGHSMGALLAKELTIKHPNKVIKSFLISYPFHDKEKVLERYNFFDRKYAEGTWWTKILCKTEILYKWLFYPYFFIFKFKYRRSYVDFFNHTYQSAHGSIRNTIFKDKKENLSAITEKVILINGEKDRSVDFLFLKGFNNYIIARMGHVFFGYEKEIADVIKSNI